MQESPLVFVSYSSEDQLFVDKLVNDLREHGVSVWLDHEQISVGDSVVDSLAIGLANCTHLVIVLSNNFLSSLWCKAELKTVLHRAIRNQKKSILPVVISALPRNVWSNPPFIFIEDLHRLNLEPNEYAKNLPLLVGALTTKEIKQSTDAVIIPISEQIADFVRPDRIGALKYRDYYGCMHVLMCDPMPIDDHIDSSHPLSFITEEVVHFLNYECGIALNFSLRNNLRSEITVYSIEPELVDFYGENPEPFRVLLSHLPSPMLGASAPIMTHALFVKLSPNPHRCVSWFGANEASAGSRGILYDKQRFGRGYHLESVFHLGSVFHRIAKFLGGARRTRLRDPFTREGVPNCIPPGMRLVLKPDESDAFHCQIVGEHRGIYFFRFKVMFHYQDKKAVRYSDEVYPCFAS